MLCQKSRATALGCSGAMFGGLGSSTEGKQSLIAARLKKLRPALPCGSESFAYL